MVKTFDQLYSEDITQFLDSLNPVVKPDPDELFKVHGEEESDLLPEIPKKEEPKGEPKEEPKVTDTPPEEEKPQAPSLSLSDEDIDRIAQAILKLQEKKGE